uniref:Coiled-coil domain containing 28A n=1 Tax=Cyprinus carpio TaxID=7962 RepID=A0A8C2DBA1_CYPCA
MNGSDYRQSLSDAPRFDATETRFSAWTPVTNKACNQQLFQERTALILHWFDLWTDRQRKEFICQLLKRCSKTQLKFTRDCLAESVPITRMDFTAVLPRFLSLYIMSFLSPRDICSAAQVCWHWKFLAEQDCLWSPKCIRLGWFLPYSPSDHEYGAWKRHYVACTASLDILTPREAAGVYGTLNESLTAPEEQQDRWREHNIRQTIRQKVAEHKSECQGSSISCTLHGLPSDADRRSAVCKELLNSEKTYVRQLQAVATVYYTPLRAALDSNRAIISSVSLITIFCPLLDILETNSVFLKELTERWEEWGPLQCVGDVCVKFCTKLRVYTNFFNNYPTILRSIDKCREMLPVFRSFLKRHDRTVATRMLSLQEMFLTPSARVEEYVTLLQALTLHTPSEHPDYTQLSSAFNSLLTYRCFIHKVCLKTKMYEHVSDLGLFLFNDALVLTERSVSNMPFCLAVNTTHTFLASVALHCLNLTEITDTKYVRNAFQLESPKRQWICATDREEDKIRLLSALRSAINAAITRN